MKKNEDYDWDEVLSAASRLQGLVREAVLVGGTASALFAGHRTSYDADHVIPDLRRNFDQVLSDLESVAGWQTARIKPPVLILGSLDGVETGVRQLIRSEPLETTEVYAKGQKIVVPTEDEILRIKGALILKRNATRDYLDFAALSKHLGDTATINALRRFDELYPQKNGASALQQLYIQLACPRPYDLQGQNLSAYKNITEEWKDWNRVAEQCASTAVGILNHYSGELKTQEIEKHLDADIVNVRREHQHLLETAPSYTEQLRTLIQSKEGQALQLESRLEAAVVRQRETVATTRAVKPGPISSLWKGAAWEKTLHRQQARLDTLENRLSRVRGIRTGMAGKRLTEFARKKLQRADPELVAKHDVQERERRQRQAEETLRLAREKERTQTQSRGRSLKPER